VSAERLARLFAGSEEAHTQLIRTERKANEHGKVEAAYRAFHGPPNEVDWQRHLKGVAGLTIIPLRADGTVIFAAIDLDTYPMDATPVLARLDPHFIGDDDAADEPDGDMDDDDAGPELGGPRGPRGGAGSKNSGRSKGLYEVSGVNVLTNARMASVGAVEGSYDDRARPSSVSPPAVTDGKTTSRIGSDPRTMERMAKLQGLHPRATSKELIHFATAPKDIRKAIIRSLKGAA
jgi:hypothetical protein